MRREVKELRVTPPSHELEKQNYCQTQAAKPHTDMTFEAFALTPLTHSHPPSLPHTGCPPFPGTMTMREIARHNEVLDIEGGLAAPWCWRK